MNTVAITDSSNPRCYTYSVPGENLFTIHEYSYDEDGVQFCNIQYFDVKGIYNLEDCLTYIDNNFANEMEYVYSVEEAYPSSYIIRLRYFDLYDQYEEGYYEEYVFYK